MRYVFEDELPLRGYTGPVQVIDNLPTYQQFRLRGDPPVRAALKSARKWVRGDRDQLKRIEVAARNYVQAKETSGQGRDLDDDYVNLRKAIRTHPIIIDGEIAATPCTNL